MSIEDNPKIMEYNDGFKLLLKDSYYSFGFVYSVNDPKDSSKTIYKHIILTQDIIKTKNRKILKNMKLYPLDKLKQEINSECINVIFSENVSSTCSVDELIRIRKKVMIEGCRGIINSYDDVLLYSVRDFVSEEEYVDEKKDDYSLDEKKDDYSLDEKKEDYSLDEKKDDVMITVKYGNNEYYINLSNIDSDYLKNLVSAIDPEDEKIFGLFMYEDIFKLIISNKDTITDSDIEKFKNKLKDGNDEKKEIASYEYLFNGLSYFGNNKMLTSLLNKVKNNMMKKIISNIEQVYSKEIIPFFEKYIKRFKKGELAKNTSLTEDFFVKNFESETFIKQYLDKVDWYELSKNTNLSEAFFERHLDKVDWNELSKNTNLSEAFFERYLNKVKWSSLSQNTSLSEAFFERHLNKVDWYNLSCNTSLSEAFFERHLDKANWNGLSRNTNLSEAFFERYLDKVKWISLSQNTNLSEAFFERHLNKVDWNELSKNTNLSEAFFERHLDKVEWLYLSQNTNLSEFFFERHLNKVEWYGLSRNTNLSPLFFDKYFKYIYPNELAKNNFKFYVVRKVLDDVKNTRYYSFDKVWKKMIGEKDLIVSKNSNN